MKKFRTSVLACFALVFLFTSCEDEWNSLSTMGYVIEIVDDGAGQCTYYLSSSPDNKERKHTMTTSCGLYKVGEGIFVPQE